MDESQKKSSAQIVLQPMGVECEKKVYEIRETKQMTLFSGGFPLYSTLLPFDSIES